MEGIPVDHQKKKRDYARAYGTDLYKRHVEQAGAVMRRLGTRLCETAFGAQLKFSIV